ALLFADDTKVSHTICSPADCSALQADLDSLTQWSHDSKLSFNSKKCYSIRFDTTGTDFNSQYKLCGHSIHQVNSCRDLGIIISDSLSWSLHYRSISSKAYGQMSLIRRTFSTSSIKVRKLLYISLVRSKLVYGSQLWRPMYIKDIVILERIQRRATRFITNDYVSNYRDRLLSLRMLPLMYTLELLDILFFIKCL
uniref:Reverse transcriptase domain-containing protein n=1 Tax=Amphimedon queenslandica TaxID=400682 RepID=A0A1X7TU66_AMPQE